MPLFALEYPHDYHYWFLMKTSLHSLLEENEGGGGEVVMNRFVEDRTDQSEIKARIARKYFWACSLKRLALRVAITLSVLNGGSATAADVNGKLPADAIVQISYGPQPQWLSIDTTQHLIRWAHLDSVDLTGEKALAPSGAAAEFNKAIEKFSKAINKPVNRRSDLSIFPTGEVSNPSVLYRPQLRGKLMVLVAPYSDDEYLKYLVNYILGETGENYQDIFVLPTETSDIYLMRVMYIIRNFNIESAFVIFNSKIFESAYSGVYSDVYKTVFTGLMGGLSPLFTDRHVLATVILMEQKFNVSTDALLAQYMAAIGRQGVEDGMQPTAFKAMLTADQ